jgi:AcrR family transcriptional regulator
MQGRTTPRDGSGTRAQILSVALRLFAEQGYDRTSLREIADEVGVTKAALYYHFRTKDDIVRAVLQDFADQVDEIAAWMRAQAPGPERDAGFVDRMFDLIEGDGSAAMHLSRTNPTVLAREEFHTLQAEPISALLGELTGPTASADAAMRSVLAYVTIGLGSGVGETVPVAGTPDERHAAARAIALELLAAAREG